MRTHFFASCFGIRALHIAPHVRLRPSPLLVSLATAVPEHVIRQEDVQRFAASMFAETLAQDSRLLGIFANAQIDERRVCRPLEWLAAGHSFAERNAAYVEHALELSVAAVRTALARAGLQARDIDRLVFVSSTGLATPSMDARILGALGCRAETRRTPIWGLGCAGGTAGKAHARDFALADPAAIVVLVTLELCSLTFQHEDRSKRNLVAASLFGDGAAAAVVVGAAVPDLPSDGRQALQMLASHSTLWPDTLDIMGWTVDGDGLHVLFSRDIPTLVRERVRPSMEAFLARSGLGLPDIAHMVMHPGGTKVLLAYGEALGLPPEAFTLSREVLRAYGNMSSPSCLFVLDRFLETARIAPGEHAVLASLGPGFSAEYLLLRGAQAET